LLFNIEHLAVLEINSISVNAIPILNSQDRVLRSVIPTGHGVAKSIQLVSGFELELGGLLTGSDEGTAGR